MKLNLDIPKDLRGGEFSTIKSSVKSTDFTSSTVREKLSSTRQLLEQTLQSKPQRGQMKKTGEDMEESLHNQLKKPDFTYLNNIYENYSKAPVKQKVQYKSTGNIRSSSAPPVWQKTREQLILEKEEKFKKECTFKPRINAIPQSRNLDYTAKKFDRDEWFKGLTRPKTEIIEQRERLKREKEEEDSRNCSFRPNVTSYHSTSSIVLPVEERLYSQIENKQLKREQLKREKEEFEASAFPYSPQVSESTAVIMNDRKTQPPLYQRLYQVQSERAALRQLASEKKEHGEGLTFRPYLSPNSRKIAENKCTGNVIERLSRDNSQCKDRTENSVSFSSVSTKSYSAKEFLERQQQHLEKSLQKKVKNI